ncbi:glycosyltransferase family protein [Marinobacter halotolerans]|uniref:glycosyltransferase family 4 protein n=1 Tax=Marinobacter halotolerans TaxID=1569211 RepID=UPI001244B7A1|nr:glycosyltransferase family 4 protein [Marinobacter halotolerans]
MAADFSHLSIIFHHPRAITENGSSGSQVRPYKMLTAFRQLGVKVTEVTGDKRTRSAIMRDTKARIKAGEKFDFVYSENLTIPFAMSESHRLPLNPLLDHRFLTFCNKSKIPVSMFYRDAYWRDGSYREMLPWFGRAITVPLYWFDWLWQMKYLSLLYLPSKAMGLKLPWTNKFSRVEGLPPGSEIFDDATGVKSGGSDQINLFYVGGIEPPMYDLRPLLTAVKNMKSSVSLTVCCREKEWIKLSDLYRSYINDRVQVVHHSGKELIRLYKNSDLFALVRNQHSYLDFAVPTKVYESVGFALPILCCPGDETARRVASEGLGWVVDPEEISNFLQELSDNPKLIEDKKKRLIEIRKNHSWTSRAASVCNDMTKRASKTALNHQQ